MIRTVAIQGYRSLRDLVLPLGQLSLMRGANGRVKSSIGRSLRTCSLTLLALPVCSAANAQKALEVAQKTTVCELEENRQFWNHKLVQVTGFASHGFEDSGFSDPTCNTLLRGLWMSYGGSLTTGTMSTVNEYERNRKEPIVVEGVPIPLLEDGQFRRFDALLHALGRDGTEVHATVIGRFFSGRTKGDDIGGYGHLGCCSLFVIQQVLAVDENLDPTLDNVKWAAPPTWCSSKYLGWGDPDNPMLRAQREADAGTTGYAFTNPERVAAGEIAKYSNADLSEVHLKLIASTSQRRTYEGTAGTDPTLYRIVVNRPAWLAFYAAEPKKVAWVVLAGFSTVEPGPCPA